MSNPASGSSAVPLPARRAPVSTEATRSAECSGLKKIANQPSAISPASSRFLGPTAAR